SEDGYAGEALTWHRWTGASLFFAASVLCLISGKPWYGKAFAGLGAMGITGLLLMTGHYGATLTHGDGFILQPIAQKINTRPVTMDEAIVYADVIQPILERKCVTCHNENKLKGELLLTDSLGLLAGGKTGPLFIPGNSEVSLMMQRIHLPIDQEKHMPPDGNAQLTSSEITLLSLWINQEIGFHKKLIDLPEDDSIRVMAAAYISPVIDSSSLYDFPAADDELIKQLNSNDRNISRVSKRSPALEVSIYRRDGYGVKQLEELEAIREQIVTLKLNKLPVRDEDLRSIGQFDNLRRLELNFSDITDGGLRALTELKQLRTLSLSGTKVTYAGLKDAMSSFGKLKTITLWNTALSIQDMSFLRQSFPAIDFVGASAFEGKDTLTLNPPLVKNPTLVFRDSVDVLLGHPIRGVEIRYTLDGTIPDSLRSPVFRNALRVTANTRIMAR
ncbi:MAG: c-type cytochrome domain-containing protein, partial [Chitinophagaceae bacterium]